MIRIDIKPLSVNKMFRGRRFKTKEYELYIIKLLKLLPNKLKVNPKSKLKLTIEFGYSSKASDVDNGIKGFTDTLVKKYGFDDRNIYELHVFKEITKKGEEFINFKIEEL